MTVTFEHNLTRGDHFIYSPQSDDLYFRGRELRLRIYKVDPCQPWCLVVLNDEGEVIVWPCQFSSDRRAREAFDKVLAESGFSSFWEQWSPRDRLH